MRKSTSSSATHRLTGRRYALTTRGTSQRLFAAIAAACALAALGAAGFALHASREQANQLDARCAPPVSEAGLRDQLARAQLSLEQESAERAAIQKQAETSDAELQRLRTELMFFQRQHSEKAR
jgi:hypothetical protein